MATWKKNVRKIPPSIFRRLNGFQEDQVVAAVVRKIPLSTIAAGIYKHVGISTEAGQDPTIPPFIVPLADQGKFSERNVHGWEVVRKDLPLVPKTVTFETPNWGDWSNGSHETEWTRDVYQREFHSPPELAIKMELLAAEPGLDPHYIVKFQVADVLNQSHPEFEDLLLFDLNLLQENVGACDVFKADADLPDFLQTITVEWEILPPGDRKGNLARILSGRPPDETTRAVTARYDTLAALKPQNFINGQSGFRRYFGAKFDEDLVVFENIEYGNAAYIMFDHWELLSKKTRLELLAGPVDGFIRIVHRDGWESALETHIREHRQKKLAVKHG
jgi:hypothetical protein